MTGGEFTPAARAAIFETHHGLCAGCLRAADDPHHRRPRGAGGTSNPAVGEPFNGLPLCRKCHDWAESRRNLAYALGWLVREPSPADPWWSRLWGWRVWVILPREGDAPAVWAHAATDTRPDCPPGRDPVAEYVAARCPPARDPRTRKTR